MSISKDPFLLPDRPILDQLTTKAIEEEYERLATGLPRDLAAYLLERYGVDIRSRYAGYPVKCPFGKASGQLSLNPQQVRNDAEAGLGFSVLKTVIAVDTSGKQSMHDWAIPETHMKVERIQGRSGRWGWTVTWTGRGWYDTFDAYLDFFRASIEIGQRHEMLVVPSCKFHLPSPGETEFRKDEYDYTMHRLVETWEQAGRTGPMPLEKDFSPTLAGSDRATEKAKILEWLESVPGLIKQAVGRSRVRVGIKVMNTLFEDEFQLEMLKVLIGEPEPSRRADFIVYANRLFDPNKEFQGKKGVAYGGPDLSDRNLRVLTLLRQAELQGELPGQVQPISGTGDIHSGKMALEYALRGVDNFQMHTLFQLPDSEFAMKSGSKTEKVLHRLIFHPQTGLLPWMLCLRDHFGVGTETITMTDVTHWYREAGRSILLGQARLQRIG
jgi:dihydroorotate dehydrogenase